MIMHIHESFNWVSQSHQKLSYDYLNFKTPAPLFNQKPGKHVIPNNVRHTRTSCSYAQRTLNFTPSMAALIMENVWHQTLWRIIPFQLSVDNVKIIIRRDSSVDRQHLFIMERREGGGANNLQMCSAHAIKGLTWNSFHLSYFSPLFVAHLKQDPFMLTCIISPVAWLRLSPLSVFGGMHSKYVVQFFGVFNPGKGTQVAKCAYGAFALCRYSYWLKKVMKSVLKEGRKGLEGRRFIDVGEMFLTFFFVSLQVVFS